MAIPKGRKTPRTGAPKQPSGAGSGTGKKRPPRRRPAEQKPSRVSNPYDEEEVFSDDSLDHDALDDIEIDPDDVFIDEDPEGVEEPKPPRRKRPQKRPAQKQSRRQRRKAAPEPEPETEHVNNDVAYGYTDNRPPASEDELLEYEDRKEAYDFYDEDQEEVEIAAQSRKRRGQKPRKEKQAFVDTENLELEPYGSRKNNKKLKVSDFDKRKDRAKNAKIFSTVVIVLLLALIALGVKNALVPPETMSQQEVAQITRSTMGVTDFPEERGRSFAEDFMTAFISTGSENESNQALSFFYTGSIPLNNTIPQTNKMTVNGGFAANVILPPRAYSSTMVSSDSAYYVVGTLVQPFVKTKDNRNNEVIPEVTNNQPRWMFFQVNVFYDKEKDTMFVTPDSPILMPSDAAGAQGDIPAPAPLGTGQPVADDVRNNIAPNVFGFVEAYGQSTINEWSKNRPYLTESADETTKKGLGGTVSLAGQTSNAVHYDAFATTDPNVIKLLVVVDWKIGLTSPDSVQELGSIGYKSTYVMTMHRQGESWLVQRFTPYIYIKGDKK